LKFASGKPCYVTTSVLKQKPYYLAEGVINSRPVAPLVAVRFGKGGGNDVYAELLKALETGRVDAVIIDQPCIFALERHSSIDLTFQYLQDAVRVRDGGSFAFRVPVERIGVETRIGDDALRDLLGKYAQKSFTLNLWHSFYPGPPQ
jgi:hypothetical protein